MDFETLELADYRRRVAAMYLSDLDLEGFRRARDELFRTHSQSAVPEAERAGFTGLRYFPPSGEAVVTAALTPADGEIEIDTGGPDGVIRYRRVAIVTTVWGPLTLWWLDAYGGGLFLPFRDGTSGKDQAPAERTYGAGRYLTDTVKGTFGRGLAIVGESRVRLDFNYAYNASCAYDDRWACPLAPPENRLAAPIRAGELTYHVPAA